MDKLTEKIHLKNLDGIRAMAATMVIFSHLPVGHTFSNHIIQSFWSLLKNGGYGVHIFFVLSGFLITRLILADTNFSLKKFYLKRIYRIWPLYYLVLAVNFLVVLPILNQNNQYPGNNIWLHLFFLSNYNLYDLLIQNQTLLHPLHISWSVSIEEQFYLFWPLIFVFFKKDTIRITIISILMLLCLSIANMLPHINGSQNSTTASAIWDLGFGAIIAFLHFNLKKPSVNIPRVLNLIIYGLFLIYLSNVLQLNIPYIFKRFLNSLCFAYLIFEQCTNSNNLFQFDKIPFFKYLGKISYGIYMLHPLCLLALDSVLIKIFGYGIWRNLFVLTFSFPLIWLVAGFSYKYYESYFLKLKTKLD